MPIDTVPKLIEALRDSRLFDTAQLEEIGKMQARSPDARTLLRELIQRSWLTPYQVNQIVQGNGKDLVLGGYRLLERIGSGGMGQVFKARHQALDKLVALKVIRKEHIEKPEAVARFRREIRAVSQLSHPNIVMAFDADQVGDTFFFAMEFVDGIDLLHLVRQAGPLPVPLACEYMRQTALALQHASERGLVHRDIKPANLLVARGSLPKTTPTLDTNDPSSVSSWSSMTSIKILDMGLARLETPEDSNSISWKTQDGKVLGTPDYIAPEQALKSSAADIRADLYSLGCTFFFILAGKVPFPGGTMMEKLLKHRMDDPPAVEKLRPEVPGAVSAIVRKLMAKKPEDRYQTPAQLATALADVLDPAAVAPATAAPVVPMAVPMQAKPDATLIDSAPLAILVPAGQAIDPNAPMAIPLTQKPGFLKKPGFWMIAVGVAVLLAFIILVAILAKPRGSARLRDKLSPAEDDALTKDVNAIVAKVGDSKADVDKLRQELIRFRLQHPGTPQAERAAVELERRVPSLLAGLKTPSLAADETPLVLASGDLVGVLGEHRQRHWGPVLCAAYSSDGGAIATGGGDGTIRLWDASTMRQRVRLTGHTARVNALAFAERGKVLATASADGTVRIFKDLEASQPREDAALQNLGGNGQSVACAPDQKTLAYSGGDGAIFTVDISANKPAPRQRTKLTAASATALAFAPGGKHLAAVCTDHFVRIWDLDDDAMPVMLVHNGAIRALAYSPDGKTLAVSMNQSVVLWDVSGTAPRRGAEIAAHVGSVFCLDFCPTNNRLLALGGIGGVAQLLNLDAPASRPADANLLSGHTYWVNAVAFAPNGRALVTGGQDGTVRTWSLDAAKPRERLALSSHTAAISSLAFNHDGSVLATAGNGDLTIRLWDYRDSAFQEAIVLRGFRSQPSIVAFSPDGKRLAGAGLDNSVKLWDVAEGSSRELNEFTGHTQPVCGLAFAPDGKRLYSAAADNTVRIWSLSGGEHKKLDLASDDPAVALALSADGKTLATAGKNGVLLFWDATATVPKKLFDLDGAKPIQTIAFAPDGMTLAVAGSEGPIRLIDLKGTKPKERATLTRHTRPVTALAYSPSGYSLASTDEEGRVCVWTVGSERKPREWLLPGSVRSVAFSPDGQYLATGNGNGTIYVLRLSQK